MDRSSLKQIFLGLEVWIAFLLLLAVYFLPPLLLGNEFLFESPATPVWRLSTRTTAMVGCVTLSCVPIALGMFAAYTYLLAVIAGAMYRELADYGGKD